MDMFLIPFPLDFAWMRNEIVFEVHDKVWKELSMKY